MSLRAALTYTCSIYHLKPITASGTYGLPGETTYDYGSKPDVTNVPCYYKDKATTMTISDPTNMMNQVIEMQFLPNVKLELNDKVVINGVDGEFILEIPRNIRGKLQIVEAIRRFKQL